MAGSPILECMEYYREEHVKGEMDTVCARRGAGAEQDLIHDTFSVDFTVYDTVSLFHGMLSPGSASETS